MSEKPGGGKILLFLTVLAITLGWPFLSALQRANFSTVEFLGSALLFSITSFHTYHIVHVYDRGWNSRYFLDLPIHVQRAIPKNLKEIFDDPAKEYRNNSRWGVLTFAVYTIVLSVLLAYATGIEKSALGDDISFIDLFYHVIISTMIILVTAEFGVLATLGREITIVPRNFVVFSLGLDMSSLVVLVMQWTAPTRRHRDVPKCGCHQPRGNRSRP